ncbi:MAG: methionyl-tRNA formyltransferase [Candidatus Gastranaerophilales bacterium]|nr:methionyl-tRNA formyltransferase [Candidatus Gastranaerophilales bacterium]
MKIIFFGIPDLGLLCLNALIEKKKNIVAVVLPVKNNPTNNLMAEIAGLHNIPVLAFNNSPKESDFIEAVKKFEPDIAFVCAFDNKIPEELLKIPPLGFVNCHPSLLPHYRGGNPYFHVIMNNEKKTGVTIHYMDKDYDTGDIITQSEIDINPDETFGTIFDKLNQKSIEMITDIADKFEREGKLPGIPQNFIEKYKTAPNVNPDKADISIDWTKNAVYIERFIRACNPIYGATSYFRRCSVKIWSAEYSDETTTHAPGTIVQVSNESISVSTGKGLLMPKTIQIGFYMITDIKDFIRRTNPQIGEIFS